MGAFPQCRCDLRVCNQPGKIVLALGCNHRAGIDHKHDDKASDQAEQEAEPTVEAAEPGLAEARRDQRGKGEPEDDEHNEWNGGGTNARRCWDQTLSFYDSAGQQYLKDRKLHFYPCSLSYFSDGEYIVIGGSDRRATLCTKEAVRLCTICEKQDWVWSVRAQPYPMLQVGRYLQLLSN